mmetsp:Transcript_17270/g.26957  ORF Transcript_17270/g.26957 Transcript_17270/m.26957 type:complete len:256 (-) Transcript_17270:115-882(-)
MQRNINNAQRHVRAPTTPHTAMAAINFELTDLVAVCTDMLSVDNCWLVDRLSELIVIVVHLSVGSTVVDQFDGTLIGSWDGCCDTSAVGSSVESLVGSLDGILVESLDGGCTGFAVAFSVGVAAVVGAAVLGVAVDGVAVVVDGAVVDGVAEDGVAVDGVAVDGVAVDGVAVDGVAVDGVAVDGVAVFGAAVVGVPEVEVVVVITLQHSGVEVDPKLQDPEFAVATHSSPASHTLAKNWPKLSHWPYIVQSSQIG